jgi:hypothetical protein
VILSCTTADCTVDPDGGLVVVVDMVRVLVGRFTSTTQQVGTVLLERCRR